MKRWVAALTAAVGTSIFVSDLAAQTVDPQQDPVQPAKDVLIASWQLEPAPAADAASGVSLDWIRRTASGPIFTAGGGSYAVGDSRWILGRIGATVSPTGAVTLSGHVSLGGGSLAGARFDHRTVRGDVAIRATPHLLIAVGDEYLSVDHSHGHLLRAGAGFHPSAWVAMDLTYATSAGGNLNTSFMVARVDFPTRPVSFFGGGAYGRTTPEVVALTGTTVGSQHLRQGFVGATIPFFRSHLRVAVDVLSLASITRRTLTLALEVPIRR